MARLLFGSGARGQAIEDIQAGLRFETRDVDGVFGRQTRTAVEIFQQQAGLRGTGHVDDVTWDRLLQRPIPELFERCLALTAAFEGHGYSLAQGNFDGAGITWGIIGFTLKHGGIAEIVFNVHARRPDLVECAFDGLTQTLLDVLRAPTAARLAFADSVSIGSKMVRLADPWRNAFDLFGKFPEVRDEQRRLARQNYFEPAQATAASFGLLEELGLALAFDIHVQNGRIKRRAAAVIRAASTRSQTELRRNVANAVADSASARFREDVRARKLTIASGEGTVHGERFTIANWGVGDFPVA